MFSLKSLFYLLHLIKTKRGFVFRSSSQFSIIEIIPNISKQDFILNYFLRLTQTHFQGKATVAKRVLESGVVKIKIESVQWLTLFSGS